MKTKSDHIDWSTHCLPVPEGAKADYNVITCLVVLTLFPAFPELDRVPAQNKGGKAVSDMNTTSPIGVGETAQGFDIYI
jgi:hypothetical protein